jgi:hypothetical protein
MHRGITSSRSRIGALNAPLSSMNLTKQNGYVRGSIGTALTAEQRKAGGIGFTTDEWRGLSARKPHQNGKMTRGLAGTPLKKNHDVIAGQCCDTSVDGDNLIIHAMVDLSSAEGRQAWQDIEDGKVTMFSVGFIARAPADWDSGNREYDIDFREVSLTEKGVVESAYINVAFSQLSENSGQTEEFELKDIATGQTILTTAPEQSTATPIEVDSPLPTAPIMSAPEPTPMDASPVETAPPAPSSSPAPQAQASAPTQTTESAMDLTPEQINAFKGMDATAIAALALNARRAQQLEAENAEMKKQWQGVSPLLESLQKKQEAKEATKRKAAEEQEQAELQAMALLAKETGFGANLDDPNDLAVLKALRDSGESGKRAWTWLKTAANANKKLLEDVTAKEARLSVYEPKGGKPATRRAVEAAAPAQPSPVPSQSLLANLQGLNKQPKNAVPAVAQQPAAARQELPYSPYSAAQHQMERDMNSANMNAAPVLLDASALALEILNKEALTGQRKCNTVWAARERHDQFPVAVTCSANDGRSLDDVYHYAVPDAEEDRQFGAVRRMGAVGSKFDEMFFYDLQKDCDAALCSTNNPISGCSATWDSSRGQRYDALARPAAITFFGAERIGEEARVPWSQ